MNNELIAECISSGCPISAPTPRCAVQGRTNAACAGSAGAAAINDGLAEEFSKPSTSRNASVRQILGRPGEVWLPESGADKLMVVRE